MKKIGIIGGDLRNRYLFELLKAKGEQVCTYGLMEEESTSLEEVVEKSDYIISGTPFSRDNISIQAPFSKNEILLQDLWKFLKKDKVLFAGNFKEEIKQFLQRSWIGYYDFLEDERTTILNVIPTVEGAIELAIRETNCTLFRSKVLVLGYGRIGKYLSRLLHSFGAEIVVAARKESDLTWITLDGNKAISYTKLDLELEKFDFIFNTVPFLVIDENRIKLLKSSCYIIDLASKPGGVDFDSAEQHGIKAELALGLPGKVAPKSAAQYMFEFFEKCTNC